MSCDALTDFDLKQFKKTTPYFQYDTMSFYFNFCGEQSLLNPCPTDAIGCTTSDGKEFTTYATKYTEPLALSNDKHSMRLLCGDHRFHIFANSHALDGEYTHPFFCPYVKNSCNTIINGFQVDLSSFSFEHDGQSFTWQCVDDASAATSCDNAALCLDNQPIKPFLRHADEKGVSFRFQHREQHVELHLKCKDTQRNNYLFDGGPPVDVIIQDLNSCPYMANAGGVGAGTVLLSMSLQLM